MKKKHNNFYNDIRSSLGKISDLEKSLRNMGLEDLYDTNNLFSDSVAYDFVLKTIKSIKYLTAIKTIKI